MKEMPRRIPLCWILTLICPICAVSAENTQIASGLTLVSSWVCSFIFRNIWKSWLRLQRHIKEYLQKASQASAFDFIIGSSHFIDKKDPYFPDFFEGKSEREVYEHYFEVTLNRIRTLDCFDSFGHLDYIVRYGPSANRHYSFQAYQDHIDPILKALVEKGKSLECNTAGFRYGLNHPNPSEDILKRYHELGGELITLGSDAHSPKAIACEFDRMQAILKDCGFRYIMVYRQRKPHPIPL